MSEKNDAEKANEAGQEDGSGPDGGYNYNGWAHSDNIDQYNAGYRNARDNEEKPKD